MCSEAGLLKGDWIVKYHAHQWINPFMSSVAEYVIKRWGRVRSGSQGE